MTLFNAVNIPELLINRIQHSNHTPAIHLKIDGRYLTKSWFEIGQDIKRMAILLSHLGVQPGQRVVQVSENRYQWIVADLAIQLAQGVHVPAHSSLTGEQIAYQINDSEACVVLVSNEPQVAKLVAVQNQLRKGLAFVSFDETFLAIQNQVPRLLELELAQLVDADAERLVQAAVKIPTDSLATILYTSGTTGEPKGVMLTQKNLVSNALGTLRAFEQSVDDIRLCFLPLSHIFARTCDLYTWIASGSQLALAESRETVLQNCKEVAPTLMNGVPYFFDKIRRVLLDCGRADVPGAVRELLGGRVRYCCSGGAALPDHVFDFYYERGVPVLQGYGLTESSPVITISKESHFRRGAVGRPIPEVEVRIGEDGEIQTRGPHVMQGYWKKPEATAEVIRDGWLLTGDLGRLDADGYLYITGRKKEILVTSGGKNVAPVLLESLLMEDPLIHQALIVGDGQNYLAALIVPNPDKLRAEISARQIQVTSKEGALKHPAVRVLYEQCIFERLRTVSQYEQVRKFVLIGREFSVETGEMTQKLSLRRKIIEANFAQEIAEMYAGDPIRGGTP